MTDASEVKKSDEPRVGGGRGPAYPWISLEKAVQRLDEIRTANVARTPVKPIAYFKIWSYKGDSGPARQTLAALNHFGLTEYVGRGDEKNVQLTPLSNRIIFDKVPNSPERAAALREAAANPPIYARLLKQYPPPLPPDYVLETFLTRDCGYNDEAAKTLLVAYKGTLKYAGLDNPDNMPAADDGNSEETPPLAGPKIGDLVQVEIDGVLTLPKASRVRAIQDREGQKWVFVEGSETGIPMEQVRIEQAAPAAPKPPLVPPVMMEERRPAKPGMHEEKNTLDEGEAVLIWPEKLSAESVKDLEYWLQGLLRKAKRRAGAGEYFAEVYAADGIKAKELRYFDDFKSLLNFVNEFKKRSGSDILRVHVPARSTDDERRELALVGAQLV